MSNRHMKRCSTTLIIRAMEIFETIMSYHCTSIKRVIKRNTNNKCWKGCEKKGILKYCWWKHKLMQPLWKTVWRFLKKLKIELSLWPANSIPRYILEKKKQKHKFEKIHVPQCSQHHYLQLPRYRSNLSVHQQISG